MSQDSETHPARAQLLDALRLFMSDLGTAAYEASKLVHEADPSTAATDDVDAARLEGLGDNLTALQSWVVKNRDPFSTSSVTEVQLLARLNLLHSQAEQAISEPDRLAFSKYFQRSIGFIKLLVGQPSVNNIGFLLETLQFALEDSPRTISAAPPKPSDASATQKQARSIKITVFVAAGKASWSAAGELALKLSNHEVGSRAIKVHQSWQALPNLSQYPLGGVTTVINQCQYGILVLAPEETTANLDSADPGNSGTGHLRLPTDVEFLLGLMVGFFTMKRTFLVVPATEENQPELASFLNGLEYATYDPTEVDGNDAMGLACTRIIQSISKLEKA